MRCSKRWANPVRPGSSTRLPDVVRHVHRDERDSALRRHDDGQAVREALDVVRDLEIEGNGASRCPAARGPRNIPGCLETVSSAPPSRPLLLALPAAPAAAEDPRRTTRPSRSSVSRPCSTTTSPCRTASTREAELYWAGVTADWTRGSVLGGGGGAGHGGHVPALLRGQRLARRRAGPAVKTAAGGLAGGQGHAARRPARTRRSPGRSSRLNGVTRNPGWGAQAGRARRASTSTRSRGRRRSRDRTTTWAGRRTGGTWSPTPTRDPPGRSFGQGARYTLNRVLWSVRPGLSAATAPPRLPGRRRRLPPDGRRGGPHGDVRPARPLRRGLLAARASPARRAGRAGTVTTTPAPRSRASGPSSRRSRTGTRGRAGTTSARTRRGDPHARRRSGRP